MTSPYYHYHVFCCQNRREESSSRGCCASKGAEELHRYFKQRIKELGLNGAGKTRVNTAGCLDRCEFGPVIVIYPEGCWYRVTSREDIDAVISSHIQSGTKLDRLLL